MLFLRSSSPLTHFLATSTLSIFPQLLFFLFSLPFSVIVVVIVSSPQHSSFTTIFSPLVSKLSEIPAPTTTRILRFAEAARTKSLCDLVGVWYGGQALYFGENVRFPAWGGMPVGGNNLRDGVEASNCWLQGRNIISLYDDVQFAFDKAAPYNVNVTNSYINWGGGYSPGIHIVGVDERIAIPDDGSFGPMFITIRHFTELVSTSTGS